MEILFYFLTLLAEIIGTVGGFGSSVFFVPMASYFFDFQAVLGLTAFYHLFSNSSKILLFFKGLDKGLLVKIGIPSIIFVILGAYFSKFLDGTIASIVLGGFLILFSLFLLLRPEFIIRPITQNAIIGGSVSGLTAGLLGTGGAIRGLTLAAFHFPKASFLATSAAIDFGVDASRFVVYFSQDYINREMLFRAPVLLVLSLLGTYIGKRLLEHISQDRFRQISLWLILFIGIVTAGRVFFV